jgi:hypothetical protein
MSDRELLKTALILTPECLSPEQLEGMADSAEQNHPHVKQCPRCQTELALLRSFQSDTPLRDEGAAVAWISLQTEQRLQLTKNGTGRRQAKREPRPSFWDYLLGRGKAGLLILAGAVLVVTIASLIVLRPSKEPNLRADLGNHAPVFRSQQVELIGPLGELQRPPTILQWQAYPGADAYKVTVLEIDHTPLWTANSKQTQINIPESLRAMMHPNKPILWQVTAVDTQDKSLATSQLYRFSVTRKNQE